MEAEQAKPNKASGYVLIRPLRATARHGRAGEPSLSLRSGVSRRFALSTLMSGTAWMSSGGPNSRHSLLTSDLSRTIELWLRAAAAMGAGDSP